MDDARIFHVNVNCSDLDRSRRFYVDGLGLTAAARTTPERAQPGAAFGFDRARWDAWILVGAGGFEGGAVDLLEWMEPRPTGSPPPSLVTTGWQRVGVAVEDVDATVARVRANGGAQWSAPTDRRAVVSDPDGTAVALVRGRPGLAFVAVGCTDLGTSRAFYRQLGFHEI